MFNELVESTATGRRRENRWAFAMSMTFQAGGLLLLLLIPLFYTQGLPGMILRAPLVAPVFLVSVPQPEIVRQTNAPLVSFFTDGGLRAPTAIPDRVWIPRAAELPPEIPADAGVSSGLEGWNLLSEVRESRAEAPLPPVPVLPQRIRQSHIEEARILFGPQPAYPVLARQGRIQGNVVLHAIIDREGRGSELQVISGHPLLVQAALAAVRQWRYQPTLVSGVPVEVETTITVRFVLGG